MGSRGTRLNVALAAAVALIVAAVFVFGTKSPSGGTAAAASSTPRAAAETFAAAYLRYLDGEIPLSDLPDADAGVLATANGVIIPAPLRAGQLTLALMDVYDVSGSAARATFGAVDRRHHLATAISLAHRSGEWEVVGLVPPDFSELYPPPKIPPAPSQAQQAAASFVLAYVDYREGVRPQAPSGLPLIIKEMTEGQDPLAHVAATHEAAQLDSLRLGPVTNGSVAATAQLSDGGSNIGVLFTLHEEAAGWIASEFILSR